MKSILSQFLSLVICLELIVAPFPKQARAQSNEGEEITTYTHLVKTSHAANVNAFGEHGIAKVKTDPKTGDVILNRTGGVDVSCTDVSTDVAVHEGDKAPNTVNCKDAALEAQKAAVYKDQIARDALKQKSAGAKNVNCEGCGEGQQTKELIKEGPKCTPEIRKQVAELEKNDKSCSADQQIRKEATAVLNGTSFVGKARTCVSDFARALWDSLKKPFKDGWNAGKATFASVRTAEDEATKRMHLLTQLPKKDVDQGAKGPKESEALNESIKDRFINALAWLFDSLKNVDGIGAGAVVGGATTVANGGIAFFTGLDIKEQVAIYGCADCASKLEVGCKLFSRMGYDVASLALVGIAIGGVAGTIKGVGAIRSAAKKAFGAESSLIARDIAKATETRAVEFAGRIQPVLATDAEKAFADATRPGPDKIASQLAGKKLNFVPATTVPNETKVLVSGGNEATLIIAEAEKNHTALSHVRGLELAKTPPVQTLDEVTTESKSVLKIGSNRPETPGMAKARTVAAKFGAEVEDINNATPVVFETGSKGEIKALDQELHVNLAKDKKPSPVTSVHTYGTGEKPNFIVEKEDGRVAFLRHEIQKDGSSLYVIDHEFNRNEAKSVRALVDPVEHDKAAQILLDRTKANAELSGIEVRTVASSAEESGAKKELEAEVKPTKECPLGSKVILAK